MEDMLRNAFIHEVRTLVRNWSERNISTKEKSVNLAVSFLELLDREYRIAPLDENENLLPEISGEMKSSYLDKQQSSNENLSEFLEFYENIRLYWLHQDGPDEDRLSGFMFSVLNAIDGGGHLPPYFLASKKEESIDLGGFLHEVFYERKKPAR